MVLFVASDKVHNSFKEYNGNTSENEGNTINFNLLKVFLEKKSNISVLKETWF